MAKAEKAPEPTPAPPQTAAERLLGAVRSATADDLAAVDGEIAARERDLDAMRQVRRRGAAALGVEPVRKHGGKRAKGSAATAPAADPAASLSLLQKRQKCVLLLKKEGPKSQQRMSELTGISRYGPGALSQVLACDWFHISPEGVVSLTDKGDRAMVA